MRIAFSGVQCTGKTTLLNELEKLNLNYDVVKFVVRDLVKTKNIKVNKDGNEDTQIQIVNQHLKNLEGNNIFVDRCLLDCMAYTTWMFNKGQINQNTFNYVKEKYEDNVNRYDIIFYLRPEFKIVDDGFRSLDIKFRDEVLEIFEELVKNLKNIKVLTGSVDERIKTILNYI